MNIRARWSLLGVVVGGWVLLGSPVSARAGAWVYPKGTTWLKLAFAYQSTGERYFLDGERIPYFFEGHNETAAGFLEFRHGLGAGFDVLFQLPIYTIRFDDLANERRSSGIADVRAGARWNFLAEPLVATVEGVVKFPTGEFVNDAEVVPVGEGQYDFEVGIEVGRSLWPRPGYLNGQLAYRVRTENEKNGIDPGDEILWSLEGGYDVLPKVMVKALIRGLYGFDATSFGLPIASLRREVVYFEPGILYQLTARQTIEFSVPVTVRGKNWPAGLVLLMGYSQTF